MNLNNSDDLHGWMSVTHSLVSPKVLFYLFCSVQFNVYAMLYTEKQIVICLYNSHEKLQYKKNWKTFFIFTPIDKYMPNYIDSQKYIPYHKLTQLPAIPLSSLILHPFPVKKRLKLQMNV